MDTPSKEWREYWHAIANAPGPEKFAVPEAGSQPPEVIQMRNAALQTYLDGRAPMPLYRLHVPLPGQTQARVYPNEPSLPEAQEQHRVFGTIAAIMRDTVAIWSPQFATVDDAKDFWWSADLRSTLSPQARNLFDTAWNLAATSGREGLIQGPLTTPIPVDPIETRNAAYRRTAATRPAISPDMPSATVAPPADQMSPTSGEVLAKIAEKAADKQEVG